MQRRFIRKDGYTAASSKSRRRELNNRVMKDLRYLHKHDGLHVNMNPGPEERVNVLTGVKVVFEEAAVRFGQ